MLAKSSTPTLFLLFIIITTYQQTLVPGIVLQNEYVDIGEIDISAYGTGAVIQIRFEVTSNLAHSPTFLAVSDEQFDSDVEQHGFQLSSFYQENPLGVYDYDLDAMWDFRDQYINIRKRDDKDTLYYVVSNYDDYRTLFTRRADLYYTIELGPIGEISQQCAPCQNGGTLSNRNCICDHCDKGYTGKICSRKIVDTQQTNFTVSIDPMQMTYLRIPPGNVKLQAMIDQGLAQMYIQLQSFSDEAASFYNVALGKSTEGRFEILPTEDGSTVQISTEEKNILITIANRVDHKIQATLILTEDSTVSILVIVMGILGALLLAGLIIAAICIVKKNREQSTRVNSEFNLPSDANKLSGDEIERYFPSCQLSHILGTSNSGEQSINQMKDIEKLDLDCVICLEQIQENNKIRIGYCRHIFHSDCLIGWFKKQRNCPYCRKEYNKTNTQEDYDKLCNQTNKPVLKDIELVSEIYKSKPSQLANNSGAQEKLNVENIQ